MIIGPGITIGPGISFIPVQVAANDPYFNVVPFLLQADPMTVTIVPPDNNTFMDSSLNALTVTKSGTPTQGTFGPFNSNGWSAYLDGSNYCYVPTASTGTSLTFGTSDYTIEGWFNKSVSGVLGILFDTRNVSPLDGQITVDIGATNQIHFTIGISSVTTLLITSVAITIGVWHHIALVKYSGTYYLYVDGALAGSAANATSGPNSQIVIGADYTGAGKYVGYVSNFRIVKGTAVYTAAFTPSIASLTAITNTQLLTFQNNRFVDNSTNAFALSASGTPNIKPMSPFPVTAAYSASTNSGSMYFGGTSDYLTLAADPGFTLGTGDFTIECWVYPNSTAAQMTIYDGRAGANGVYPYLYVAAGGNVYYLVSSTNRLGSNNTIPIKAWSHIVIVRVSSQTYMYINGVNATGSYYVDANSYLAPTTGYPRIGADMTATTPFSGYISDFRFVKGTAIYTSAFTPPVAPLTAVTGTSLLLKGANAGIIDSSGKNDIFTYSTAQTYNGVSAFPQGQFSSLFNGSSDYTRFTNSTAMTLSSTTFTIECWVNLTGYPNAFTGVYTSSICGSTPSNGLGGFELSLGGTASSYATIYFGAKPGGSGTQSITVSGSYAFALNTWYHVALVKNGTAYNIYVNGTSVGNTTSAATWGDLSVCNVGALLVTGYEYYLKGYISNFRIVNGTAVYTTNFTPPTSPLTAISGTGSLMLQDNRYKDNSTANAAITIGGTPKIQNKNPFSTTYSSSLAFNGSSDYTTLMPSLNTLFYSDFTIECWFYPQTVNVNLISNFTAVVATDWALQFNASSQFNFTPAIGGAGITSGAYALYQWYHVAIVRSGTTLTQYVNGVAAGSMTFSGTMGELVKTVYLGKRSDGYFVNGYIEDFRITNGYARYTAAFTPDPVPIQDYVTVDSYYGPNVSLLLHCNGAHASTAFPDSSPTPKTATNIGTPTISAANYKFGGAAIYFNGTSCITYPNSAAFQIGSDWTIEAWAYRIDDVIGSVMSSRDTGTTKPFWMIRRNVGGAIRFYWISTTSTVITDVITTQTMPIGTWTHIAVVRTAGTVSIYLNGSLATLTVTANATTAYETITLPVVIGSGDSSASAGDTWNGYVDEVRITKGVARYSSNFSVQTVPFYDNAPSDSALLLHGDKQSLTYSTVQNSTFIDSSPNPLTITRTGNVTQGSFTPYSFNGWSVSTTASGTHYFTVPFSASLAVDSSTSFCVEGWFNPDGTGNQTLLSMRDGVGATSGWEITYWTQKIAFGWDGSGKTAKLGGITIPANVWTHFAVTFDGTTLRTFINGVIDTAANATSILSTTVTAAQLKIGIVYDNVSRRFSGNLSNIRIVKGSAVYTTAFTPSTSPLTAVANTQLLTLQDNRFKDNSTNNFTITPSGSPRITHFSPFALGTKYTPATHGASAYFDGSGDYLSIPNNTVLNIGGASAWTFECWFYATSTLSNIGIAGKGVYGTSLEWSIYLSSSTVIGFGKSDATGIGFTVPTAMITNAWYHLALSCTSNSLTVYVNGISCGTQTILATPASGPVYIGSANWNAIPTVFQGYLADVRIIKGTALYSSNFTPPTTPLTANGDTSLLLNFTNTGPYDASGNHVIETVGSAQISNSQVNFGTTSMRFNGTSDYLTVAAASANACCSFGLNDFTVEGWIYPTVAGTERAIIGKHNNQAGGGEWLLELTSGNVPVFFISTTGSNLLSFTGVSTVPINTWTHLAVTRSGSTFTIWINGTLNVSGTNASAIFASATALYVGCYLATATPIAFFPGSMADIRITRYARYTANFTAPTAPFLEI